MKRIVIAALLIVGAVAAAEVTFDMYNDAVLYGYLDNQAGPLRYTNTGIVATFEAIGGVMNRVSNSGFGIDAPGSGDTTYALDINEALHVSFEPAVTITGLDFRNFDDGEAINVIIGTTTNTIVWADLGNKTSDSITGLSWNVASGMTVSFEVVGATDIIAVDAVTVIPEPATISMLGLGALGTLIVRRFSRA